MKIESIVATINGQYFYEKLSDGVNFIYYSGEDERISYQKAFQLAFDNVYYADTFYQKNDVNVQVELTDENLSYRLEYEKWEFDETGDIHENLFIEGKPAPVYCPEIREGLIASYLKKHGDRRMLDCGEGFSLYEPKEIIEQCFQKEETDFSECLMRLCDYLKNSKPMFINRQKNCRLLLLANGEIWIEGEDEDDDEQYALAEYFKFAITAQISDRVEEWNLHKGGYPLLICGLLEKAGKSADIPAILEVLKGYSGQVIFLCPQNM